MTPEENRKRYEEIRAEVEAIKNQPCPASKHKGRTDEWYLSQVKVTKKRNGTKNKKKKG